MYFPSVNIISSIPILLLLVTFSEAVFYTDRSGTSKFQLFLRIKFSFDEELVQIRPMLYGFSCETVSSFDLL